MPRSPVLPTTSRDPSEARSFDDELKKLERVWRIERIGRMTTQRVIRPISIQIRLVYPFFFGAYKARGYRSCVVVIAPLGLLAYLSNQLRRYNCVRRKFDGVLDVPWYSLFTRISAVGMPRSLSAR